MRDILYTRRETCLKYLELIKIPRLMLLVLTLPLSSDTSVRHIKESEITEYILSYAREKKVAGTSLLLNYIDRCIFSRGGATYYLMKIWFNEYPLSHRGKKLNENKKPVSTSLR